MNVVILVCTFGSYAWAERGALTARAAISQGAHEVVAAHHPGGSLSAVRNAAARAYSTADWLCFLDADDALAPGYVTAMMDRMADADVMAETPLLVPAVQYVRDGSDIGDATIPNWHRQLIDINCAVIGTLIQRDLFLAVGGFRELPSIEDWDLWVRCVKAGAVMVATPAAVYRATVRMDGRNSNQSPYPRLRREHLPGFDWPSVDRYKAWP